MYPPPHTHTPKYKHTHTVCGFEAFINGKHIVGQVKEKEQAHREYKEAISKGHGAYLMDEETPVSDWVCPRVNREINHRDQSFLYIPLTTLKECSE